MARFFVPSENITEDRIVITGSDVKHLKNVLRARLREKLTVCDSKGNVFDVEIATIEDDRIICDITGTRKCEQEPKIPVILLQGVPKGDKPELIIQKNVELGINEIRPVITERTIVKFASDADREKKTARFQKISDEAAKQCGRGIIPKVEKIETFKEAVEKTKEYENWLKLIPYENEQDITLKQVLRENAGKYEGIFVFIGPEGGFSQKEIDFCINYGFTPVTLGKRILRTETAGFATVAAIRYELGD